MNWINRAGLICFLLCAYFAASAQEMSTENTKTSLHDGFYLGGQASTNGWGFTARYAFNDWFSLKTGYESLSLSYDFDFDENDISYDATLDYKTGGILLLADFDYTKNLYISAGVVLSSFNPEVTGTAANDFEYGDIIIPAEDIGQVTITAEPTLKTAPYISAGYRAFWGKRDAIVFQFETGLYYMGPPDLHIEADGLMAPTADPAFGQEEYLEYQFNAYKIYPVIKIGLAFKLF
jgi:hypothetical protein